MSITLHYSGTLRSDRLLAELVADAIRYARSHGWKHVPLSPVDANDDLPGGVLLLPPGCEPVHLCFDGCGRMGYRSDLRLRRPETWIPGDGPLGGRWEKAPLPDDFTLSWGASTRTQNGGAKVHQAVVELLRLVSEKYMSGFSCTDESGYWDDNDEAKLQTLFAETIEKNNNGVTGVTEVIKSNY